MRKNHPRFKDNCVCPAQTCRHSSHANRDTLMISAWHIMAQASGTVVATQSCSRCMGQCHPGGPQELLWVAEGPCTKAAPWLGQQCTSRTPKCLLTRCLCLGLEAPERLQGARAGVPSVCVPPTRLGPQGRTAGKQELLWQTSAGSWVTDSPAFF